MADQVVANGVNLQSGPHFSASDLGHQSLPPGAVFMAIANKSQGPISGTFADLPEGRSLTIGTNTFRVSYFGGDGNDLTLTVLP